MCSRDCLIDVESLRQLHCEYDSHLPLYKKQPQLVYKCLYIPVLPSRETEWPFAMQFYHYVDHIWIKCSHRSNAKSKLPCNLYSSLCRHCRQGSASQNKTLDRNSVSWKKADVPISRLLNIPAYVNVKHVINFIMWYTVDCVDTPKES